MEIKRLTPFQLHLLTNTSIEKALFMFGKCNTERMKEIEAKDENFNSLFDSKHAKMEWTEEVDLLSEVTKINLDALIIDVHKNFCKNRACIDYVFKKIEEKMRPNKKGFYPLLMSIPKEVAVLISDEQKQQLKEMAPLYLSKRSAELMKSNNIQIR